nr:MAG TPA: hypothetical protein [Caudoviricetes sp.]
MWTETRVSTRWGRIWTSASGSCERQRNPPNSRLALGNMRVVGSCRSGSHVSIPSLHSHVPDGVHIVMRQQAFCHAYVSFWAPRVSIHGSDTKPLV